MEELRASSDLLSSSSSLKNVVKVECITIFDQAIIEHSLDVETGLVASDNFEEADPALCAIVTMLHNS